MVCRAWSQLCGKANVGELHPDDAAAWCEAEDECPVSARAVESLWKGVGAEDTNVVLSAKADIGAG
ncbi:hypothetical protein BZM26_36215 [Paraburkholderia strydomiana]|nr:hypothetical protein BZM26_36215 [Paraburkholderia strydomiana]